VCALMMMASSVLGSGSRNSISATSPVSDQHPAVNPLF
jgi:hypothetical protein